MRQLVQYVKHQFISIIRPQTFSNVAQLVSNDSDDNKINGIEAEIEKANTLINHQLLNVHFDNARNYFSAPKKLLDNFKREGHRDR